MVVGEPGPVRTGLLESTLRINRSAGSAYPSQVLSCRWSCSDSPHQCENDHYDQDEAKAAAGVVAPAGAVGPGRQGPDQQEN